MAMISKIKKIYARFAYCYLHSTKLFSWPTLRPIPRFTFIYHIRTIKYVGSKGSSSKAPQSATFMSLIAGIWVFEITVAASCVRSLRSCVKIDQIFKHEMKNTEVASKSINSIVDMSLSRWWPWRLLSSALCCAVVCYNPFAYFLWTCCLFPDIWIFYTLKWNRRVYLIRP